jgi:hypothetical protein
LSLAERLFGLNREADDYLGRTIENLKKMVAGQATELAFSPSTGIQFNAAIASAAFRTDDIGLSHGEKVPISLKKGHSQNQKGPRAIIKYGKGPAPEMGAISSDGALEGLWRYWRRRHDWNLTSVSRPS